MFDTKYLTVQKQFEINGKLVVITHQADSAEFIIEVEGDNIFYESIDSPDYHQDERMIQALSQACDIELEYKLQVYTFLVRCMT